MLRIRYLFPLACIATLILAGVLFQVFFTPRKQGELTITTGPGTTMARGTESHEHLAHYDMGWWTSEEITIPEDMWVTGFSGKNEGNRMHNFYLFLKGTRDEWCPENPIALYSAGTVTANRTVSFPNPYGIYLQKGNTLVLRTFFVGEQSEEKEELSLTILYERASLSERAIPMSLHILTPGVCDIRRPIFSISPHSTNLTYDSRSKPFVFKEDSVLLHMAGHFHGSYTEGLENLLEVFLNDERITHASTNNIGNDENRNPKLLGQNEPFPVNKGDSLWMRATFNNPDDTLVAEGMAVVGFYTAPR